MVEPVETRWSSPFPVVELVETRWSSPFPVVELLDVKANDVARARAADNLRWLQEEVWPRTAGRSITKDEINELLGFDEMGDE